MYSKVVFLLKIDGLKLFTCVCRQLFCNNVLNRVGSGRIHSYLRYYHKYSLAFLQPYHRAFFRVNINELEVDISDDEDELAPGLTAIMFQIVLILVFG